MKSIPFVENQYPKLDVVFGGEEQKIALRYFLMDRHRIRKLINGVEKYEFIGPEPLEESIIILEGLSGVGKSFLIKAILNKLVIYK